MSPLTASAQQRTLRRVPKRRLGPTARWAGRLAKVAVAVAVCVGLGSAWRSGRLESIAATATARGVVLAARCGFRVDEIQIVGRSHTDKATLLEQAQLTWGDPILGFDPEAMRQRIEALPWVESAAVERRLPGTVAITIVERTPVALWQHNERLSLIDAKGANLGAVPAELSAELPQVVGGDAPTHVGELLGMFARYPEIAKRVQASSWIGSRRWNLRLDNGVDILLPENGAAEAMGQLADAETATRILERDVAAIDLRLPGRMVVRMTHDLPPVKPAKPPQRI